MCLGLTVLPKWFLLLKRESFNSIFKISHLTPALLGNIINQSRRPAVFARGVVGRRGAGVNSLVVLASQCHKPHLPAGGRYSHTYMKYNSPSENALEIGLFNYRIYKVALSGCSQADT